MKHPLDLIDLCGIRNHLSDVCSHYEKTAPTVERWANDLFILLDEDRQEVRLCELLHALQLKDERGEWLHPHIAANQTYKLMHLLGRDTTGHAGY